MNLQAVTQSQTSLGPSSNGYVPTGTDEDEAAIVEYMRQVNEGYRPPIGEMITDDEHSAIREGIPGAGVLNT